MLVAAAAAVCVQVGFMVAAGMIGRLASVFSLFDQPMQQAAQPVPPYVLQVRHACSLGATVDGHTHGNPEHQLGLCD